MSSIPYFISDLHLSHKKIIEFSKDFRESTSIDSHDKWVIDQINSVVKKRDVLYLLGDIAFSLQGLQLIKQIHGIKKLVPGNHDKFKHQDYEDVGIRIIGSLVNYKEFLLSHAPIHPEELRGRTNIHGHSHDRVIQDKRYINVCVEQLNGVPISLDKLRLRHNGNTN